MISLLQSRRRLRNKLLKVKAVTKLKKGVPKSNLVTIENESKQLKIKQKGVYKEKHERRTKSKNGMYTKRSKAKGYKSKLNKAQILRSKMKAILKINLQIHKRAAVVIQRWYRGIKILRRERRVQKDMYKKAHLDYNTSPPNKDIASLQSSQREVIEKRVIIDIHTNNKEENYNRNRLRKKSKHNFSFGNNAKNNDDAAEDITASKDTDFERYKRKKKEDQAYKFNKRGRNIFDSDKGEDGEEAYDYYDFKSYNENYELNDYNVHRKRKGKLYNKTVNEEEEKKLEFSSNIDNSIARPGSGMSSDSEKEDRIKRYYPKNLDTNKTSTDKKYIIDEISGESEGEYSSSKSPSFDQLNRDDHFNISMEQTNVKTEEKHIIISDKYSIEQDLTDDRYKNILKTEESKDEIIEKEKLGINIGLRNYYLDDLMVKRPQFDSKDKSDEIKITKNLHGRQPSYDSAKLKKELSREASEVANNNLDLKSVRSSSRQIELIANKKPDCEDEKQNNLWMFSDLSKDYNDSQNNLLSNTLDICSLSKLRRMFGSERLIREYRTSDQNSQIPNLQNTHELKFDTTNLSKPLQIPKNPSQHPSQPHPSPSILPPSSLYPYHSSPASSPTPSSEFMATSDLLALFTSENVNKTPEQADPTLTLFDKNPFKDFTTSKIDEMLKNKNFSEMQDLHRQALDYRASVECKLLDRVKGGRVGRGQIEKWVEQEVRSAGDDEQQVRFRTMQAIADTNLQTGRIYSFIQNLSSKKIDERNTIDELLRTDSDQSPLGPFLFRNTLERENSDPNDDEKSDNTIEMIQNEEEKEGYQDMNVSETTQELIERNYDNIFNKSNASEITGKNKNPFPGLSMGKETSMFDAKKETKDQQTSPLNFDEGERKLEESKDNEGDSSVLQIGPNEISKDYPTTSESDEGIIVTEVNLFVPELERQTIIQDKTVIIDHIKVEICDEIIGTLVNEIQEWLFPFRGPVQGQNIKRFEDKYSEKAVFNMNQQDVNFNDSQDPDNVSDMSLNEYEGEIMHNFNIMRNFEMKRTRIEKQNYDNMIFISYVDEVFEAILSREDLFLKAFSKPIQKDYLECLTKLHYHGQLPDIEEDLENSMINELDNQA